MAALILEGKGGEGDSHTDFWLIEKVKILHFLFPDELRCLFALGKPKEYNNVTNWWHCAKCVQQNDTGNTMCPCVGSYL